jgi:uncharacterized membrane protein
MNWFLLAIISAVFSAAAALFQKKILFSIEALDFSLLLSFFNVVLSIPFLLNVNYTALSSANLLILYFKSILGALAFLCVMLSIKNLEISKALPLLALTPGLVAIFAFVFINDSLSIIQVCAILLLLSGTYILEARSGQKLLDPFKVFIKSKNHHYVVFALLLFTTTSIIDRLLLNRYQLPPNAFLGFQHIFFAINFLIIYIIFKKNVARLFKLNSNSIWLLIILVSVLTVVYRYTEILAVKIAPVAMVLSVKRISVFFAVLIGGKIFKEKNLLIKTLATVLIIIGIILITR